MSTQGVDDAPASGTPVGRDTARGFAGLSTARVVSMALQLVMFAALAGHLGEAGIGLFGFGLAAAQLFDVVANLGFKQVVTRDVAQTPEDEAWLIPNYLYLRGLLGLVAFGALSAFVVVAGYDAAEREVALIAGTLLLLTTPQATQPMLEVRLRMGPIARADVIEASLMLGGTLLLIAGDAGVTDFLWLYVGANLVNSLLIAGSALALRGELDWRPRPDRWTTITRAAVVLGVASVFISIYYQIDIALLARLKPAADVGNYTAAFQALGAVNVIPAVLMTVLAPVLARSFREPREILQRRYSLAVHLVSLLAVPVAIGGALTAWRFLPLIPPFAEFGRGGVALSILSIAAGLIFVGTIVQATLIAGHLQRQLLSVAIMGALANLGLNLLAIPQFSLYGAAAATVVTELAVVIRSHRIASRRLSLRWPTERTVRLLIPAAAMLVVGALTFWVPVLVQMPLIGATYVLAILLTGSLRAADVVSLRLPRSGRAAIIVDGQHPDDDRSVPPTYRAVRAAVGAAETVEVHSSRPLGWPVLLGARAAGAGRVIVHRAGSIGRAERWRLDLLADDLHGTERAAGAEVLIVNEGALGTGILGHLTALASLRTGLESAGIPHDVEIIGGPQTLGERIATAALPGLGRFDLDLQPTRWHATMARRTRRALRGRDDPRQLIVLAHTISMGLLPLLRRVPSYVFLDATVRQWAHLGLWRKVRPWSDLTMAWSLRREREIFRTATIIAFSEWAAEGVRAEVPDAEVIVLSPGIDTDRFLPDATATTDRRGPVRLLFVGGRFAEKGGFDLLVATEHLRPDRVLIDAVTSADIGAHAGVTTHRLRAASPELVRLYQTADIFCLPTRADGSPFVVLEALATATPVISTPVGAIPSLVGSAGIIVGAGDIAALRDAIESLVEDPERRQALAESARRRATQRFSAVHQGAKLAAVLCMDQVR